MSVDWQYSVCQNCSQYIIRDLNEYVDTQISDYISPIDMFYSSTRELLRLSTPAMLSAHPILGNLLLVGLISATEKYFRDIFSGIVKICPISKKNSCNQSVKLGSVIWSDGNIENSIFEHISFADFDQVIKTCKNFIGHDIKGSSLTYKMLNEFDQICQMRHCIAHVNSFFAAKNAINLGIEPKENDIKVKIEFDTFQECMAICTNLAISVNIDLFSLIATRWANDWRREASWEEEKESKCFDAIWKLFFSEIDSQSGTINKPLSKTKCKNQIKKRQ